MKDRLVVTVSDVNGTKAYNLNRIIKKVIIWAILLIVAVLTIGFFVISKLSVSVKELSSKSEMLQSQNELYSKQIKAKVEYIDELSGQLDDIEEIIGINKDDESSLIQRATLAKLSLAQKTYMLETIPSGCPMKECTQTSAFGWRVNPITKDRQYHKGLDLRAKRRTPVHATADGVVRYVQDKNKGTFGRVIIISHNFGFETVYGHLRFTEVKVGDVIKKGQLIAKSGNSGRSSGPHLHYEVRYASKILNPNYFINWDIKSYDKLFEKERRVKWESLVNQIKKQSKIMEQQ